MNGKKMFGGEKQKLKKTMVNVKFNRLLPEVIIF